VNHTKTARRIAKASASGVLPPKLLADALAALALAASEHADELPDSVGDCCAVTFITTARAWGVSKGVVLMAYENFINGGHPALLDLARHAWSELDPALLALGRTYVARYGGAKELQEWKM
jgi:hypothetical protein